MTSPLKLAYVATGETLAGLKELDCVRLRRSVGDSEGRTIPAGSLGAVLISWDAGSSYEVELAESFPTIAVVRGEGLELERPAP